MKTIWMMIICSIISFANIEVVIANSDQPFSVSKKELADLYLGKTKTIRGIKVTPIDNTDPQSYQQFYQKVANKTPQQIHAYWIREMYRGDKVPPKRFSNNEIKKLLTRDTNVIAYALNDLNGQVIMTIQ